MYINSKYKYIPKKLLNRINKQYGRHKGTITVRHKGGGMKYLYTNIDFTYRNYNSSLAILLNLYLDYNRNSVIALILLLNGDLKGYQKLILSTNGIKLGNIISYTHSFPLKIGSVRNLEKFYIGANIHSIEVIPFKGAALVRSMATKAEIVYCNSKYTCIKLPSSKIRLLSNNCLATFGQNSIIVRTKIKLAGSNRYKNIRPTVRGVAMNSIDHPHGGGCGRSSIGLKSSKTPWGKLHYGVKTTKFKKINRLVL